MEMSQTKQQEQGAAQAKPKARKDWELFWRIIAGLMLAVIAWVVWVLYQITPRSVVTPLAYQTQVRPIATTLDGAATAVPPPAAADQGQPAAIPGAHQASAEAQAAAQEQMQEQKIKGDGLRLATELSMPPPATGAAGKDRP